MLATAIIVFREILEAALIIGIVAAATRGVLRRSAWISGGVVGGCIGAVVLALLADQIANLADGMGQEVFNASILLLAVVMLAWHNIWMSRHSRELVAQMKQVGKNVQEGGQTLFALALVVGLAVLREGAEIVLFLYGQKIQGVQLSEMFLGGMGGVAGGVAMGYALYAGLLRIPLRYLFQATSGLILLLAAGMASQAARFLVQADWLPGWGRLWDVSWILSNQSTLGRLLHALIGYDAAPLGSQMAVYAVTLLLIFTGMQWVKALDQRTAVSAHNTQP